MNELYEAVRRAILEGRGELDEKTNPYAIGMAAAEKSTGDRPPLKKSTIVKAHRIAKKIKAIDEDSGIDPDLEAELKATRQTKKSVEDAKKKYGVKEEAEQIDELSTKTLDSYRSKARTQIIASRNKDTDTTEKRLKGYTKASRKIQKNFVKGVDEEVEIVEGIEVSTSNYEFSHGKKPKGSGGWMFSPHKNPDMKTQKDDVFSTHGSYTDAKKKAAAWAKDKGHRTIHALPEEVELDEAIDTMSDARIKYHATKGLPHGRYTPKEIKDEHERRRKSVPNYHAVKASLEEEVRPLDEARGRPKKDKGYTVHPITKELLHHDNPAHMARIKTLQKNGVLPKEKKEPSEHIINRMGQAATNMTGGQHIKYDNGKTHHVSNSLASRTLTHYRGLKPADKEKFQERIAQSHEDHLDALQGK